MLMRGALPPVLTLAMRVLRCCPERLARRERCGQSLLARPAIARGQAGPFGRRLFARAVLRTITANDCTGAARLASRRQSRPGVRTGVGLSIGIIARPRIAAGTALIAAIAPISIRSTRPSIGAMVENSATTIGSAPLALKHS